MTGEGGNANENSDCRNVETLHRRRSNVATRRKPLAEIDEKELRRAKRRKNKRVSFSETTTIALFNKDQNHDPNDSNDKSQLINQFQVASETIEGVLDTSGEAASNEINATIHDGRDMSFFSDSVLSDGGSSNPNRTISMGPSDDSFQKAHNLMGELNKTVFSPNNITEADEAGGLTRNFDRTVYGSKTLDEASMCVNESMCDSTRGASDSMSSLLGADELLNEFDTTSTYFKPEHRIDSTIMTDETMCEVTRMSDTSSFVTNDSSDGSSMDTSEHGKMNISVSNTSAVVAQDFFKEFDSSLSSDSFKISNQVEKGSCLEMPAHEMVDSRNNDVQSVESPCIVKPGLPTETTDSKDAKVTEDLQDISSKHFSHPPIDLESPISILSLTLVSSLDAESENMDTGIKGTVGNSNECTQHPDVSVPPEKTNSKAACLEKCGVDSANIEVNEVEDGSGLKNEILAVTSIVSDDLIETDKKEEGYPLCKPIDVGPCLTPNISEAENEDMNQSQAGENLNLSSQKTVQAIEQQANMSVAACIETRNTNSCLQLNISAQREIDPVYLSESPDSALVDKQCLYTPLEAGLSSSNADQALSDMQDKAVCGNEDIILVEGHNLSTEMEAKQTLNDSSIHTLPDIQGVVVSRNEGTNPIEELNRSTKVEAESTSANISPSVTLSNLQDAAVGRQGVSVVHELNLSMPINTRLISKNSPSGIVPYHPDTTASKQDFSMVDELNLSMPKKCLSETLPHLGDPIVDRQDVSMVYEQNHPMIMHSYLTSKKNSSATIPNPSDAADASLVEEVNISSSKDIELVLKNSPLPTLPNLEDTAIRRQVNFIEEVNLSTRLAQKKSTSENLSDAITKNENHDKLGGNLAFINSIVTESTNINNSLNNESDSDMNVLHNDTSWLSYGDLQYFPDTELEETNDPIVDEMKQNLTAEVDHLMDCLSQNSLNIENWENAKDDTVSDKIANTISRITKLKAQNRLYASQNLSYRHHSISERSFVNTPNASFPGLRKKDCTIQKTCGRGNTSTLSSDSWIVEPIPNVPVANSTCVPEVHTSNDSTIKIHSYEQIKKDMRQDEFPSACVVEFECSGRIVIVIDKYAYHKFIIQYYSREITEIAIERQMPQGLEAEDYVLNFMANAICIPSLKTEFTTLCQMPELLHAICDSIEKWGPVANDIYRTFYKFLGRVNLENNSVAVKFFVHKILEVFSVILKFEDDSWRLLFLGNSRCEGIYQKVRETLRIGYDKLPFPFLSVCERVELLCSQLADQTLAVDTFPNTFWCHKRRYVLPKQGEEMDLDMDLVYN